VAPFIHADVKNTGDQDFLLADQIEYPMLPGRQ